MDTVLVGDIATGGAGAMTDICFDCISGLRDPVVDGEVAGVSYDGNNIAFSTDAPAGGGETSYVF